MQDNQDAQRLNLLIDTYERASGARINLDKTDVLLLNSSPEQWPDLRFHVMLPGESTRYLGFDIGPSTTDEHLWTQLLTRVTKVLGLWQRRDLSLQGRVTVINTLSLSTIWYFASVLPTNKEVLKLIESAIFRFLWRGKDRGIINRQLTMYPVHNGGLGVRDTTTTLKALHLSWLRRLLSPGDAKWQEFLVDDLRCADFVANWGLSLRVLISDLDWLSLSSRNTIAPPMWLEIAKTATTLHLTERAPATKEDVLRQHIYYNRRILDPNGVCLADKTFKQLTRRRIFNVRDLLSDDGTRLLSAQELRVPDQPLARIHAALPPSWTAILTTPSAPLVPGDWVLSSRVLPPRVVLRVDAVLDQGLVRCTTHQCNRDATFTDQPDGEIVLLTTVLTRAHVVPFFTGFICEGPLDTVDLVPSHLFIEQGRKRVSTALEKSTARGTYHALLPPQPLITVASWDTAVAPATIKWRSVWSWVWAPYREHRVRDFLWKLQHRRLNLGTDRRHYSDDGLNCSACTDALETYEHLLLCPIATEVWNWFVLTWERYCAHQIGTSLHARLYCSVSRRLSKSKRKCAQQLLLSVLHGELLHAIWVRRCAAKLQHNERFDHLGVRGLFVHKASAAIRSLLFTNNWSTVIRPHTQRLLHLLQG